MWLKIECHRNHESPRIDANSNLGSARGSRAGDGGPAIANFYSSPPEIAQILKFERFPRPSRLCLLCRCSHQLHSQIDRDPGRRDAESISSCAPMCATWAAAHLRKKFPHFCIGGVGKKILLKTPPVAEEEIRRPLINDVSRQ